MTEVFDKSYWKKVSSRKKSCTHCGYFIVPADTPNGWTHKDKSWEGIRCHNMLKVATPAR